MSSASCNPTDWYTALSPNLQKIEVVSRLSPMLETDQQQAQILSVLMDIIGDYAEQLRSRLDTLAKAGR